MKSLLRFLAVFLVIGLVAAFSSSFLGIEFQHAQYWDRHGVLFLFCIMLFPRLTLLFSSALTGGLFWWLGWIFAPRLLVAMLATFTYWYQNPVLVVVAWLVALGGESSEKYVVMRQSAGRGGKGFDSAKWVDSKPR
jgi:hypothetical protein